MKPKVALLFWGLTRGLKHTIKSIQENVVDVIKKDYNVDVFIHTYYFEGKYSNPRHGVEKVNLDFEEYKLLNPLFYAVDNQDKVARKVDLNCYRKQPDIFNNNYKSNDNYILSLYSTQEVTKLFRKNRKEYRYCVFLRPDVLYVEKFDNKWFSQLKDNTIIVPGWDCFDRFVKTNVNNRFCIIGVEDVEKYGNILKYLHEYSLEKSIMAEEFLGIMLNEKFKMNVIKIDFRFQRVLPDGSILWRDEDIARKK